LRESGERLGAAVARPCWAVRTKPTLKQGESMTVNAVIGRAVLVSVATGRGHAHGLDK
jgi:hypothetical protein